MLRMYILMILAIAGCLIVFYLITGSAPLHFNRPYTGSGRELLENEKLSPLRHDVHYGPNLPPSPQPKNLRSIKERKARERVIRESMPRIAFPRTLVTPIALPSVQRLSTPEPKVIFTPFVPDVLRSPGASTSAPPGT